MAQPLMSETGLDGVIASGNAPTWIVQEAKVTKPLREGDKSFPLALLTDATTAKIDCHLNMGDVNFTRTPTTRDRKRACEKITSQIRTGQTVEAEIKAIYDQQAEAAAVINAAYTSLPEGSTVYVIQAYGLDSHTAPTATKTKVDVYRGKVQTRMKNQPVDGEEYTFTANLSCDLYIEDATLAAT